MSTQSGSARVLLVTALVSAGALLAVTFYLLGDPSSSDVGYDESGDEPAELLPEGFKRGNRRVRPDPDEEDFEPDETNEQTGGIVVLGGRSPEDGDFKVDAAFLRDAIDQWKREAIMYAIDKMQDRGETIPGELVDLLVAKLAHSGDRLDAVAALGMIQDDATARKLADLATGPDADLDTRLAALDTLARSGAPAALDSLKAFVETEGTDPKLLRHAYPALAKMGGEDAARVLTRQLLEHTDRKDPMNAALVTALGKTSGSGVALTEVLQDAREKGDEDLASLVVRIALRHGEQAEPQLRAEIQRLVQDPSAVDFLEDPERRLVMRASAVNALASMGGDFLDEVIRIGVQNVDGLGDVALHGLRHARGDEAASAIAQAVTDTPDDRTRYHLTMALGETKSRKATPKLAELLEDDSGNVRRAAAMALVELRDPRAIKAVEKRLDNAENDYPLDRSLIDALGTMGSKGSLDKLRDLQRRANEGEERWKPLTNNLRRAIYRIESGKPHATKMAPEKPTESR